MDKNVLFEEALVNKIFQVPSEALAVDDFVSLVVMKGVVLLFSNEGGITLD